MNPTLSNIPYSEDYLRSLREQIRVLRLALHAALSDSGLAVEVTELDIMSNREPEIIVAQNPITRSYVFRVK